MITDAEEVQLAATARKALLKAITANAEGNAVYGERAKEYAEAYAALAAVSPKEPQRPPRAAVG